VFEKGDDLTLIDQHAAHERIRYEQLKSRILKQEKIDTQALLVPEVVKLPLEKILQVRPKLALLQSLGFEVEIFSDEALLFRAVPAVWGNRALTERLRNLAERLLQTEVSQEHPVWDENLFEKIAMEACRSSFKAGDAVPEFSALDLTRKLFECEHPGNCPHGRPTSIRISRNKVEEWFQR
jgi:DNA mismatch repair protein MutL